MVDIQSNPLYYAAIGGLIIGIATSVNYMLRGSVTGMSGMLYGTVTLDKKQMPKNLAIISGMLLAGGIFFNIFGYETSNKFTPFGPQAEITISTSQLGFALSGILAGFGTKLSNGCTSGHGLCGLARLSVRSFVAVITFMATGFAIATINFYAGGLGPFTETQYSPIMTYNHTITANICIALGIILPMVGLYLRIRSSKSQNTSQGQKFQSFLIRDQFVLFLVGLIFGCGMLVAGMVRRTNILSFLALTKDWNPSLMFVLGVGLTINLMTFTYMLKVKKLSLFGEKLFNPINKVIDWKLVVGAAFFGLGWGLGGLCPGPAIMQAPIFTIDVHMLWLPFFILGQFMANKINLMYPSQKTEIPKIDLNGKQTVRNLIQNSEQINAQSPTKALELGQK